MSNTDIYRNLQFGILLKDKWSSEDDRYILSAGNDFVLPRQGIYTIEGKNRVGKSLLVKMIMGVLPPAIEAKNEKNIFIQTESIVINNVKDAYRNGLVAVFQDDNLLPTLTIRQQIYLRHRPSPKLRNYFWLLCHYLYNVSVGLLEAKIMHLPDEWIKRVVTKLKVPEEKIFPEKELDTRIATLFDLYDISSDTLEKYPAQLSGGTIAKIRIINAQLTANIRILFLDEALNAIAKVDSNKITDTLKNWAYNERISVVVVTHKEDEIFRWQPIERFVIEGKKIKTLGKFNYDGLESGVYGNYKFISKFNSIENARQYLEQIPRPVLLLIDASVENLPAVSTILECLGIRQKAKESGVFCLVMNEEAKNLNEYVKLIPEIIVFLPRVEGSILVVGGGSLLNFASFISGTLHRGLIPTTLVPTTVMAIADVAIGSKGSLNVDCIRNGIKDCLPLGVYVNPTTIIMDAAFVANQMPLDRKLGLAECLKHGILQDELMFNQCLELIIQQAPSYRTCFTIAVRAQELKSRTLVTDPIEVAYGRVLLYGHLHAHSLERIDQIRVSHGLAVYCGLLLDLKLRAERSIYELVLTAIRNSEIQPLVKNIFQIITAEEKMIERLNQCYNSDNKIQHYSSVDKFKLVNVQTVAQYRDIDAPLLIDEVSWLEIQTAYFELVNDLS